MPDIRPISDLRSRFAEISRLAHEKNEPIFLTKNGYGDLVVLSVEAYEALVCQAKMQNVQNTPPRLWKNVCTGRIIIKRPPAFPAVRKSWRTFLCRVFGTLSRRLPARPETPRPF